MKRNSWSFVIPLFLGFAPSAFGQSSPKEKIIFVLRTDASMTENKLESLLDQARGYANAGKLNLQWAATPKFRRITPEMFKILERIASPDASLLDIFGETGNEGVRITPFGETQVWMVDLGNPERSLLEVEFLSADDKVLDKIEAGKKDKRLAFATLGKYRLKPSFPEGKQPDKFKLVYEENETKHSEVKPWPKENDGHWLVELADFKGKLDDLFTILNTKRYNPPIHQVLASKSTTLLLADMKRAKTVVASGWSGNYFVFRFPLVPYPGKAGNAELAGKKMFVLFPLTKEDAKTTADKLNKLKDTEVMDEILKSGPSLVSDKEAKLLPNPPAKWYEMTVALGNYERALQVEDPKGWRQQKAKSWKVMVLQFDPSGENAGRAPSAAEVQHPRRKVDVYAIDEAESAWLPGFDDLKKIESSKSK